jgi:hypothetical protein
MVGGDTLLASPLDPYVIVLWWPTASVVVLRVPLAL